MIGIYKIQNKVNGKIYVGQSINITERWEQHKSRAYINGDTGYNQPIHQAFRKYGLNNFVFEVLEETSFNQLDEREQYWIKELNTLSPNGYNIENGGRKNKGVTYICSECGRPLAEGKNNITGLCQTCYNLLRSKHIPTSEELYESLCFNNGNFSKVSQIYGVSDNAIRKWCKKYNMPFHSKDYKNIKTKQPYRKQVEQIDLNSGKVINIYNSIADAARALGMNTSTHITEVCQGIYKSAGGYGWKYKE